ncbi:lutropin-choriogonadotropic hormone receptor-like isoform X2 [Zootermopsis nevadensis]|uniref:lutropin-choriogonadotropic hormone receptor-like isoform X2 n=1 Tax=Zootermopsis nevadensis TaxID=136037 RepID=UPI000B8E8665|nr:lutropin-choriogonadotropic hormone receptor-like isoform X2 [Zootermopsis nevadensis]
MRLFHLAAILDILTLVTQAEELPTTGANFVHWTGNESLELQPEEEASFYPHRNSGAVTNSDSGFHHKILPGLVAFEHQDQVEIRYEPGEVKPEAAWEAVLNIQPEKNEGFEPLPGFDIEWGAELHGACDCWNTTEDGRDVEVECRCGGLEFTDIPNNLASDVHRITVVHAGMRVLREGVLQHYRETLREIVLNNVRQLHSIESRSFQNLTELRTVYINHAPLLRKIPENVFRQYLPSLRSLRIVHTGLEEIPQLQHLRVDSILHMVDLENNHIRQVPTKSVKVRTEQFLLNYNMIELVQNHAFSDAEIARLSLKGNRELKTIEPSAFVGLRSLRDLDLSETSISQMPTLGLKDLEVLRLQDTDSLKKFPSIYKFEYLRVAWLTYPYHCCAFQFPATHHPKEFAEHERFVALIHNKYCSTAATGSPLPHSLQRRDNDDFGRLVYSPENLTYQRHSPDWGAFDRDIDRPESQSNPASVDGVFHQSMVSVSPRLIQAYCGNLSRSPRDVSCHPEPDAFNPCEDLMGNWGLRGAVWLVAVAALVGNLAVLLVLLSSRFRMTVSKFLMCNLALADLCMGIYLLIIACMDARSIGAYFNHAIDWQRGPGCQIAGFLTVFASELSIYTLAVITSERWYAITYALHLDKRLRLGTAFKVMTAGWLYAIAMATLPLLGISGYSKTSICLPMENRDLGDQVYLVSLLLMNGLAFVLICACYGRIYCAISGHNSAAARSDTTVAKRMALLVFTDFACWAPIAFFGLTAVAGYPLIDVPHTKILLVFFYPLNSCANPYLYALLTKQYRRDLFTLFSRHGLCTKKAAKYKGADVGFSSGNSAPPNCKVTSIGGSGVVGCAPVHTAEMNHIPQRSQVAPIPCISAGGIAGPRGSPHPLRSSTTRLSLSCEQEMILRRAMDHSSSDPRLVYSEPPADSHL